LSPFFFESDRRRACVCERVAERNTSRLERLEALETRTGKITQPFRTRGTRQGNACSLHLSRSLRRILTRPTDPERTNDAVARLAVCCRRAVLILGAVRRVGSNHAGCGSFYDNADGHTYSA